MSGKSEYEYRPGHTEPIQNIDTPTEPTEKIKDLIVKVQLKLICECIIISKCFYFVNHSYNYNDIIMLAHKRCVSHIPGYIVQFNSA